MLIDLSSVRHSITLGAEKDYLENTYQELHLILLLAIAERLEALVEEARKV